MCVLMMLLGSLAFAYLVGSFCGLAANLSPEVVSFRQDLTNLNHFLNQNHIPDETRYRLREYMHQSLVLRRAAGGEGLLRKLTPRLRNEAALCFNGKYLNIIELLDTCERGVILELAFALQLQIFPPGESCINGYIYIVTRGAALFSGRVYTVGKSWGEADALLLSERLRSACPALSISYLFTYSIDGEVLRSTMCQARFPIAAARCRWRQIRWLIRRGVVRYAEDELEKRVRTLRRNSRRSSMGLEFEAAGLMSWKKVLRSEQSALNEVRLTTHRAAEQLMKQDNSFDYGHLKRGGGPRMRLFSKEGMDGSTEEHILQLHGDVQTMRTEMTQFMGEIRAAIVEIKGGRGAEAAAAGSNGKEGDLDRASEMSLASVDERPSELFAA
jgi:hypothetical protein